MARMYRYFNSLILSVHSQHPETHLTPPIDTIPLMRCHMSASPGGLSVTRHFSKIELDRFFNGVITEKLLHLRSNWLSHASVKDLISASDLIGLHHIIYQSTTYTGINLSQRECFSFKKKKKKKKYGHDQF